MIYVDLTDRFQCIQPQILLNKIENETGPLAETENETGPQGQIQIFSYY